MYDMINSNFIIAKKQIDSLLKKGRLPHAIMIEGSNEEKNTELINYVAKAAVCESSDRPCNKCIQCRKAQEGIHPDIEFAQTSGVLKSFSIDSIRKIKETANISPNDALYKVYVLNGADQMSVGAQNALLKILEEPPQNVIFIIGVKSSLSLLETIRSRMMFFKTDNEEISDAEKELSDLVTDLLKSILSSKEFEALKSYAPLLKDRQLLKKVFTEFIFQLRNAYTSVLYKNNDNNSNIFSRLRASQIFDIIDKLNEGLDLIDKNVNVNLISTVVFFEIRQIIFS